MKHSILDIPTERSSHIAPTPHGGGIAIVITIYIGLAVFYLSGQIEKVLYYALLPGLGLAVIGIIDDIKGLLPLIRFTSHYTISCI